MEKKHPRLRGLDRFLPSRADELESGKVIAIFMGRGCMTGVVKEVSKRKSLVRLVDGKEEWIDNRKLRIVEDKEWIARTLREIKQSFPTENEVFSREEIEQFKDAMRLHIEFKDNKELFDICKEVENEAVEA